MKKLLFLLIISTTMFAQKNIVVPITFKIINYKDKIYSSDVKLVRINKKYFCKKYVDLLTLKKNQYRAKHYIPKNKPLCEKDVFVPLNRKINFRFGNLEIERDGEIIKETDDYIKIKNLSGKIEKIYKDGRN